MDYYVIEHNEILQTGILEWVVFPFSRGSTQPRDWTQVFCIAGKFFMPRPVPILKYSDLTNIG